MGCACCRRSPCRKTCCGKASTRWAGPSAPYRNVSPRRQCDAMPDVVLVNGHIITHGPAPVATTILVRDGCIAAVGDARIADGAYNARRIDLEGRTLVPGFNDAHAHIWKIGHLLTTMIDLRRTTSLVPLVDAVRQRAATVPPGAWIVGRGYNEAALAEGRPPTRHDLDRASPHQPIALTPTCGHIYAVNSA